MALALTSIKPVNTTTSIGNSPVTVYTCPANTYATMQYITVTNITTALTVNVTVQMWRVPSGGSAGTTNLILPGYIIQANDPTLTLYYNSKIQFNPGDFLVVEASVAASLNFGAIVNEFQAL
ncbi:MAG TPA: hypothetical protein VKR58_06010 [Aquella sp.]|nr:hypothetical protein [Aquella sp.]